MVWILQKLHLPVVSSLGKASSLRALVNNIIFSGGAGSGARGMDPTKAPPPCGIKFGAGMLSRGVSSVGKDHISIHFSCKPNMTFLTDAYLH